MRMLVFPRSVSSAARFTLPETQFPSVIQHIIDCQIGSGIRFFGSNTASPGGFFRECKLITICSFKNQKAEDGRGLK